MKEIREMLVGLKNKLFFEEAKTETVLAIILKTTGLHIKQKEIIIKNNVIYVYSKPIYKSEIFLKKPQILFQLKEIFGNRAPGDIR